jgi:hypothetical protein
MIPTVNANTTDIDGLDVGGRIALKLIVERYNDVAWTVFICPKVGTSRWLL